VCVFVCPGSYFRNYMSDVHQILCMLLTAAARSCSGSVVKCYSQLTDDVIFAHKLRLLDVTARLRQ